MPKPADRDDEEERRARFEERKKEAQAAGGEPALLLEKNSPVLEPWQREILRIVRNIAQYFYPQKQTKVMNEGCATFVHHYILNASTIRGCCRKASMLEVLHHHSNVVMQPEFDDPRYQRPQSLCARLQHDAGHQAHLRGPHREEEDWFPEIAGCGDWRAVLKDAWANYRDESFIKQFLSLRT